jgi:hypothetical protein
MELFGIMFSIPVAFGMSMVYCAVLAKVLRNVDRLYAILYIPSLVVLGLFLVEVVLVASLGAVSSRTIVGPASYVVHLVIFFLGTPALANVLVLRPVLCKWYVAGLICTVFAVLLVLLQYGVSKALYGIDGINGPYS